MGAIPGAVLDAALAALLLILFAWRPQAAPGRMLPILALVALIRPISLAAAVPAVGPLAWYALAGFPLITAAALAARLLEHASRELHLRIERPRLDAEIAALGVPVGLVGYVLLDPAPLLAHPAAASYAGMLAILLVFGGMLEELIFRGLVQSTAIQVFGGAGAAVVFTALLSTALYWGSGSIPYLLLMAFVGCGFGLALLRGASLWGVAASHGLMLVTMAVLAQGLARQT
jgi:membrane protease YdiL (CAAX protease family)